ncbi:transposase [Verminephrobacter eiseniae EF01-2]|uniref:Transposase n=1 Tax=Verminephrobacter eiseniae (strain EF01-2) TaxID=391735 RepID=A1WEY9_VEREI|nr:transposase [Verminephrobacter eiseniae EF01-2]
MASPHRFNSREDMEQTLLRYVALYNHQLPQSALGSKTPMQAMKEWHQQHPHLFHKRPYDHPGCDTQATWPASFFCRKFDAPALSRGHCTAGCGFMARTGP